MRKIFYEGVLPMLKTKKPSIDWIHSVGLQVKFIYDDIEGEIKILSYIKPEKLQIEYENFQYIITVNSFKNSRLKVFMSNIFRYKIGDIINNLKIIESYFDTSNKGKKYYKYECQKCGYLGDTDEHRLKNGSGCPCCARKVVVKGINDICTTDPWMIPYFQGGKEEAQKYTSGSSNTIYPICPDCGRVKSKQMPIYRINKYKSIGCNCSRCNSYPNKFICKMLDQTHIDFETEKIFDWAKFAEYDFYFTSLIDEKEYIIEADGGVGHGNNGTDFEKIESLYLDYRKDMIAEKYGIEVIRIDCVKSDKEYIKNNIINSKLNQLINLNNINWEKCDEYATKNIIKEICEKYETGLSLDFLASEYKVNNATIRRYVIKGEKLGWCHYRESISNRIILVFDSNNIFINQYPSKGYIEKHCKELFGTNLIAKKIKESCETGNLYKNYYFKYKKDISETDYLQMIGKLN